MANTVSRVLHDVGIAAWFGGTLANAVALNTAVGETADAKSGAAVTNAGWDAWTPVNAAAIGAHLLGAVGQLAGNADRVKDQKGVLGMSVVKTALTAAALGATGYARVLGRTIKQAGNVPVADATTPTSGTPAEVRSAQQQLTYLQWAIPALTGAIVVVSAFAGEQQRPSSQVRGIVDRFTS